MTDPLKASVVHGYEFNLLYAHRLVEDLADDRLAEQPQAGMNHPAWVLAHLVATCDYLGELLDLEPVAPRAWRQQLKDEGPLPERARYPDKAALLEQLTAGHRRVAEAFMRASPEQFAAETADEQRRRRFPTVGMQLIYGMGPHESLHLGQVSAWRRVLAMSAVSLVP